MSCNLIYKNGKLEKVVADNGQPSILFKKAQKEFGTEIATDLYYISKSDEFKNDILTPLQTQADRIANRGKERLTQVIDRLKQTGLTNDVFLMSTQEIDAKLKELGVSEDVRQQVMNLKGLGNFYNKNKELQKIGSLRQYSLYLQQFFPRTKINQLLFHGTQSDKPFEKFSRDISSTARERGIFFATNTDDIYTDNVVTAIVNIEKLKKSKYRDHLPTIKKAQEDKYDGVYSFGTLEEFENDEMFKYIPKEEEIVVFDPDNIHILGSKKDLELFSEYIKNEQIQFQKELGKNGISLETAGFVHKNQIYINSDIATEEVAVHEFGHLWNSWIKQNNPQLYETGIKLIKKEGKKYIDYVNKTQPNLVGERLYEEALAQAIGDNGKQLLDKNWINQVWDFIKDFFGLSQLTNEQIANLSLDEFARAASIDLLRGQDVRVQQAIQTAVQRNNGNPLNLAPNGKPSVLYQSYKDLGYSDLEAERLTAQVYSDSFLNFFGDWINNPQNASKVVDENGMPLLTGRVDSVRTTDYGDNQIFFADAKDVTRFKGEFGENLNYTFLNIRNPFVVTEAYEWSDVPVFEILPKQQALDIINFSQNFSGEDLLTLTNYVEILEIEAIPTSTDEFSNYVRKFLNNDGVFFKDIYEGSDKNIKTNDYVTFNTNQIKSATENIGTFSTDSNDIRYQIIGEQGAQNLDQAEEVNIRMNNLVVAQEMEQAGKTPKEIRLATGWERGADSKWKYEVSDITLKQIDVEVGREYTLDDIIETSEVLTAYPQFRNYKIVFNENERNSYRRDTQSFEIDARDLSGSQIPIGGAASNVEEFFSGRNMYRLQQEGIGVLSHELAHAIQQQEGFYKGGSPESIENEAKRISGVKGTDSAELRRDKYIGAIKNKENLPQSDRNVIEALSYFMANNDEAFNQAYFNIAGEVEARNVEKRIGMTPQERREKLLAETESVPREQQIFLDKNGEPSLSLVLNYALQNNAKLTREQKLDLQDFNQEVTKEQLKDIFFVDGVFTLNAKKMKTLYSPLEIEKILGSVEIQNNIKNSVQALQNSEDIEIEVFEQPILKTNEINSFGKLRMLNPYKVKQETLNALVAQEELPYDVNINENLEDYKNAKLMAEDSNGNLINETYGVSAKTVKAVGRNSKVAQLIRTLAVLRQDVIFSGAKEVETLFEKATEELANIGIDVVDFTPQKIQELNAYFNSDQSLELIEPQETFQAVKGTIDAPYVKLKTTRTEEELFEQNNLVKVGTDLYIEINRQPVEQLREIVQSMFFLEDVSTLDELQLTKKALKLKEIPTVPNLSKFSGDYNYLTTEFLADFNIASIKEKQKDSVLWKNFYSEFKITNNGIELKSNDPLTISRITEYADENLKQYSVISKSLPNLIEERNTEPRDVAVNFPQTIEKIKGNVFRTEQGNFIAKDNNNQFVNINGEVFEAVEQLGNLTLFAPLTINNSEYYILDNKQPRANESLENYEMLQSREDKFVSVKSFAEKNKIKNENFDCI